MDECKKPKVCSYNYRCENNPGSYSCKCDGGYKETGTGDRKKCKGKWKVLAESLSQNESIGFQSLRREGRQVYLGIPPHFSMVLLIWIIEIRIHMIYSKVTELEHQGVGEWFHRKVVHTFYGVVCIVFKSIIFFLVFIVVFSFYICRCWWMRQHRESMSD